MNHYLLTNRYDDFFAPLFSDFFEERTAMVPEMRTDVLENDKSYALEVELPGYDKKDIDISIDDGYLKITAKNALKKEEGNKYLTRERYYGTVSRTYYVGNVDETKIKAAFNNGVLTVTFPKEEKVTRKAIAID